jgi:hypothetical protein
MSLLTASVIAQNQYLLVVGLHRFEFDERKELGSLESLQLTVLIYSKGYLNSISEQRILWLRILRIR